MVWSAYSLVRLVWPNTEELTYMMYVFGFKDENVANPLDKANEQRYALNVTFFVF